MAGTASLQRASESLARSQRVAIESEQIGEQVIGELGTQRESLTRTRDRVCDLILLLMRSSLLASTVSKSAIILPAVFL
jgi:vesicle transport through interaction with t-SNAREs protein 1